MKKSTTSGKLGKVIEIDEGKIRDHLGEMVRGTVEEALNSMLDAEADRLCKATRYQRSPERVDTRAGHYQRKLHTKAGEVTLNMPKLRECWCHLTSPSPTLRLGTTFLQVQAPSRLSAATLNFPKTGK